MLYLIIILLLPFAETVKVSFYGASHIAMPLQEAKISTNIRLRFRTQQTSAMIFLAAGRTDYCLLSLESGRVKLIYKIDDHHAELWSPKSLQLNDLGWHEIAITRYEANITMQVNEHFMRDVLPSKIGELNIHFGVFIGGLGDFSESYLNAVENFRGCISDVYYNNINVFKRARERTSHVTSVKVSWNCAAEFDAGMHESISFIEEDAFMMLNKEVLKTGENWNLEFRTIESMGSILYNTGFSNRHDYIALEIVDSRLRFLVGKGANAVELVPERNVSDGKWHNISISFSPNFVEIIVDDVSNQASFANGSSSIIELSDEFYIGGIDFSRRRRANIKGFHASEHCFRGCLRNIYAENQQIGFPSMKITQGVTVECVWKYPCVEKSPCIISGICQQYGIDEFICHCDQAYCIKADFTEKYKIFSKVESPFHSEIIGITPLQLLEGDSIFLSPTYIDILFDYSKIGVSESGILFHVVQSPKHGKIIISQLGMDDLNSSQSKYFSFIDLSTDKVKYVHNGGEHFTDHVTIDLQLVTKNNEELPEMLQGRHRFVLHANITPVNDPPILYIPSNKILRLTQGISKILNNEILNAEDPDSQPITLIYTIQAPKYGFFEINGQQTLTFSQNDVNLGLVSFLVTGPYDDDLSFELHIQVSDGMETSQTVPLKVSVVPLQLRMINNTGLVLVHKSPALITPWNLSFISNSDDDSVEIQFDVVQQPQFGVIQKMRAVDQSWIAVDSFTSSQIALGQIRYLHTTNLPQYDEFKFTGLLGPIRTAKYDFRFTFTKLIIGIQQQLDIEVNGTKEVIISCDHLFHQTTPIMSFPKNIIYTVIKAPKYGVIFVEGHQGHAEPMDSFTQNEIDRNLLRFRTFMTSYSSFSDTFEFTVTAPECETVEGHIRIFYEPSEKLARHLHYQQREKIYVGEGDRTLLSRRHFEILFNNNNKLNKLFFRVTEPPKHGSLCNYDPRNSKVFIINEFSIENLYLDDVYYCHDDSESIADRFELLILSTPDNDFQYVCDIEIDIKLQNDNGPFRVFDKTFHIVREESKILSGFDLKYSDPDLNTTSNKIIYSHINVTHGELSKFGGPVEVFSQDDLNMRRILLTHYGGNYGRISFIVTDGLYEVPGVLEFEASDPFLKIKENNASVVQEGKMVVIKTEDLSVETNLNSKPDEIEYRILNDPVYGLLKLINSTNINSIKNFTQSDIDHDRLAYMNVEVASMDKIKYRVATKGIWSEGEILIRVYPSAYWELLQIRRNQTLYVEESTSVKITRDILEIFHPNISPGDITYLVTTSPQHGYLEIQSITSDDEYNCKVYDQSSVNSEKMFYIQAGVNQSSDYFIFDVTNGITWLRDLMLKIVIIPENIYIKTKTVIVEEGKNILIQPDHMVPLSEFFINKILEYKILQQPSFGQIKSGKSKVNRFTQKQLEAGVVYYVHDGSENSTDYVQLIAVTRNKESLPFDLNISITPVNDEIPLIVTNTGLHMWAGGKSVIKKSDLMAHDYDTNSDDLRFIIKQIRGGHLAIRNEFKTKISNFTQSQINDEKIFFVHDSNQVNAKIKFFVTDDLHNTTEQVLYITTNPVVLVQMKNENLHVFPMTRKTIMSDQLSFRCSDQERDVKYIITIPPQMGRILYEHIDSGSIIEVNEFTQNDIEHGRILYEHTHPMAELKSNDSFTFDVAAFLANSSIDQVFYIEISVSSGGLLRFLPVPRLNLDEGDSVPIKLDLSKVLEYLETRAGIQSPELFIESYQPQYGQIELITFDSTNQRKIENGKRFTLNDFNSGKVIYHHDHSDTVEDKILMSVYLSPGQIFLCNITIPVSVNPVNDQPFHLVTKSPSISVVEGENKTISRLELYTEDGDTTPKDITYDIISGPTTGTILKISDEGVPLDVITYGNQFTQKDINDNRIIYFHAGNPQSTTFYFRVTDGKFKPSYEIFNIKILQVNIISDYQAEILYIQQGSTTSLIEPKHISINANVHKSRLMYNVTRTPSGGLILLRNNPTLRFSQNELENEEVSYAQSDFNKSNDTFQLNANIPTTQYGTNIVVNVIVEPFITINPISILSGDKIRLSSTFQSDPAHLTLNRYNPKITITKKPKYGKFKKIIRNSGELLETGEISSNLKEITSFTYKELKSGVVYFIAKKMQTENFISINDSFEYILTMKSIQPGQKLVSIEIYSQTKKLLINDENNVNVVPAESKFPFLNYLLITIVIVFVVLIIIVMLVIFKCTSRNKKKNCGKDQPPTLPRPDLMTMNNGRTIYSTPSEADSMPVTASSTPLPVLSNVPHCKVYPIGIDTDMQDSETDEMMINEINENSNLNMGGSGLGGRYPYGEETDDWNSTLDGPHEVSYSNVAQPQHNQSTQQRNNPLLRRNQYWV